jgi:hypothetical protein
MPKLVQKHQHNGGAKYITWRKQAQHRRLLGVTKKKTKKKKKSISYPISLSSTISYPHTSTHKKRRKTPPSRVEDKGRRTSFSNDDISLHLSGVAWLRYSFTSCFCLFVIHKRRETEGKKKKRKRDDHTR